MNPSIEQFIEHATRYCPDFPSRIKGATQQERQELEQLIGRPLVKIHADFLARMGHDDGGLAIAMDGTSDISKVVKYYRAALAEEPNPFPPDCCVLGAWRLSGAICLQSQPEGEPRVVFTEDLDVLGLYAKSLQGLLFRNAFLGFRMGGMSVKSDYRASLDELGGSHVVGEIRRRALALGFQEEWFSDEVVFCAERKDELLGFTQYEGEGGLLYLATHDRRMSEALGNALGRDLGLQFWKWHS